MKALCFECDATATCEHHVIPVSRGGTRTVPLCNKCHALAHGIELSNLIAEGRRGWTGEVLLSDKALARIHELTNLGEGPTAIARVLGREGFEAPRGGTWWSPSTVRRFMPDTVNGEPLKLSPGGRAYRQIEEHS
jgi:hypothetical protein